MESLADPGWGRPRRAVGGLEWWGRGGSGALQAKPLSCVAQGGEVGVVEPMKVSGWSVPSLKTGWPLE